MTYMFAVVFTLSYMYLVHVRCTGHVRRTYTTYMYAVHVRRVCATYMYAVHVWV